MIKMTHGVTLRRNMIPLPKEMKTNQIEKKYKGYYSLDETVKRMLSVLNVPKGDTLVEVSSCSKGYKILFEETIRIDASDDESLFYGLVTLNQLIDKPIYLSQIYDEPMYKHRGFMLDVARHFFDVSTIKSIIDLCAYLKMNVLHLHLTDDQGWRLESRRFPNLHELGSRRNRTKRRFDVDQTVVEGYYTHEDIRDIVAYAKKRYIEIIPEIDIPGHLSAAIYAYPQLSCIDDVKSIREEFGIFEDILCVGKKGNVQMVLDIIDEVIDLFNCQRLHIGCDEVPLVHWKKCSHCLSYMKKHGLEDEKEMFMYLINHIKNHCHKHHVDVVIWNDPLKHGVVDGVQIQHWMNKKITETNGVNNEIILSDYFHHYFDYPHYMTPLDKTMKEEVLDHKHIIGYEACLWTEHVTNTDKLYEMILPRLLGVAEMAWSGRRGDSFYERVDAFLEDIQLPYTKSYNEIGLMAKVKTGLYMLKMISYHDIKNIFRMR